MPALVHLRETPPASPPETRTEIATPSTSNPFELALSPDGRHIVFVASADGPSRLWLRRLDATEAQPLAGTEGASYPFWSPDSNSVGFFADSRLKRLDIVGGSPQPLAYLRGGGTRGGTWSPGGTIVFADSGTGTLYRVPASGGEPVAVRQLDTRPAAHRVPQFLPDGLHVLFYAVGTAETSGIYLGTLDDADPTLLTVADAAGAYLPSGWLLWIRAGTLVAQRLDVERRMLTGEAATVADGVAFVPLLAGAVTVSATGLVAYRSGAVLQRQLTWFDRKGSMLGTLGAADGNVRSPRVSPDGRRVIVTRVVQNNEDLWLWDGTRLSRFTFDAGRDIFPIWSSDGPGIVFDSNRKGTRNLYLKLIDGAPTEELLLESAQDKAAYDWSPDGRFLLYGSLDPQTGWDIWAMPLEGDRKPWPLVKTEFVERWPRFSPDGRWVAYMSNESGRNETYVRSFAAPESSGGGAATASGHRQVSTAGGIFPLWRADGQELYYLGPDGALMAVPITSREPALEPGTPTMLFRTRILGGGVDQALGRQYDVTRDGRFLINTVTNDTSPPITLIQNWAPGPPK
jgi:Tol biopolymer transport system component